uniref:PBAN-type neuropeptides-like protein n=1 Tax=Conopomorpha sinensis TaxID=940481 RepID=A0AAU8BD56_9NEOP
MFQKIFDSIVFLIILQLASDLVVADDFNIKEDNMERDARDRTGMWFGPRLGKRSVSLDTDKNDAFVRMLEAADVMKYYYDQLPSAYDAPRDLDSGNTVIFTPKLGRGADEKRREVDFTPRLGRRRVPEKIITHEIEKDDVRRELLVPSYFLRHMSPLERQFTPRLGRNMFDVFPEINKRVARSVEKRTLNKTST